MFIFKPTGGGDGGEKRERGREGKKKGGREGESERERECARASETQRGRVRESNSRTHFCVTDTGTYSLSLSG
jgi:hypothetical protein